MSHDPCLLLNHLSAVLPDPAGKMPDAGALLRLSISLEEGEQPLPGHEWPRIAVEAIHSYRVDGVRRGDEVSLVEPDLSEPLAYLGSQIRALSMSGPDDDRSDVAQLRKRSDRPLDIGVVDVPEDAAEQDEVSMNCPGIVIGALLVLYELWIRSLTSPDVTTESPP
jgi:hypothetical protein